MTRPMPCPSTPRLAGSAVAAFVLAGLACLAGCAPSSKTTANTGAGLPAELVFCRAHATSASTAEIALRTAQNLGTARVPERSGRELHVRTHPAGDRVVFARERTPGNEATRDLFIGSTTGAVSELRLTEDNTADDHPCWSATGDRVLFSSARDGIRHLYLAMADGSGVAPFLAAGPGVRDEEPDWNRTTDRIVWSRRDAAGVRGLFLVQGDGTGLVPLTVDTLPTSPELGPHEPTFSPDGQTVAFVRIIAPSVSRLFVVSVQTGQEQLLFDPQGEVRLPRYSLQGERIFLGVHQPLAGRQGLRLAVIPAIGGVPALVEPGEQWLLGGVDVLPAMAPPPAALPPEVVPHGPLEVQISSGVPVSGGKDQLAVADGESLALATVTFEDHEIASINCKFTLPGLLPGDLLSVSAEIVASVTRSDANTTLRTSLHNPVDRRFDTVAELPAPGTAPRTLTFTTQSLAHVTLERQVRVTVIAEISEGARAELRVDQVRLTVVRRAP